jgi:hypothetical protein
VIEKLKSAGLEQYLVQIPSVSHQESIEMQRKTQLLLLVANRTGNVKGILTGKFFEYLGAKRPILAIGETDSDLESAMKHTAAGLFAGYEDKEVVKDYLRTCFYSYQTGQLFHEARRVDDYSSAALAKKFIQLIER